MKKRIISILLSIMLVISGIQSTVIAAVPTPDVDPLWDNTNVISPVLGFDGTTGIYSAVISAKSGTTNISAVLTLHYENPEYAGSWIEIPTDWSFSSNSRTLAFDVEFDAPKGLTYMVQMDLEVTRNGTVEEITVQTIEEN